ncbi:DUF192 domain-containing protein [Candidatus Woesearchaeota archaeon]|nr:DUF192 domain-containing protein [Candidatus Woesearchaeota archaeon]
MSSILLSNNVTVCDNMFKHGMGLTFRFPKKPFAYVFVFKKPVKLAITMVFVFYPIDILFLDNKNTIVEIVSSLRPFRNYFPKNYFSTFIELPADTVTKHNIKLGSKISWSANSVTLDRGVYKN